MRKAARWMVAIALLIASSVVAAAQTSEVVFVNDTGATIYFLYASSSTADTWGEDLLGSTVFPDGETFRARLRAVPALDIRAVDSNENEYIVWNWPMSSRRVVLGLDSFVGVRVASDAEALAWLEIWNETNYTVKQIVVAPAGSGDWDQGTLLLEPWQAIHHGEYIRIEIDVGMYDTFVYDIMLVDEDGDRYIKWDVNLELVGDLVYTLDDIQF